MIRTGIQRLIGAILDCEKPIIAAVNGTAAGGGVAMVLASDLVIAADHARLIQVFVRRGLIPDGGPTYLLPRLVGLQKAKELVFFGDDLPAAEAERIGLVNKVVPGAELEATATRVGRAARPGPDARRSGSPSSCSTARSTSTARIDVRGGGDLRRAGHRHRRLDRGRRQLRRAPPHRVQGLLGRPWRTCHR